MKRAILVTAIGYIIGIIEGLYFKSSIVLFYLIIAVVYMLSKNITIKKVPIVWNYSRYIRYIKVYINRQTIIILIVSSILSNAVIYYQENQYNRIQNQVKEEETTEIIGRIASNSIKQKDNIRHKLQIQQIRIGNKNVKLKNRYIYIIGKEKIEYGKLLKISGKIILPAKKRNYMGFDYNNYLKTEKSIGSIIIENKQEINDKEHNILLCITKQLNKIANFFKERIKTVLSNNSCTADILIAILLGDTQYISEDVINDFRNANISHILAVSGMHMSYIIYCVGICFSKILGKRNANIITIIVLCIYMIITGLSPSIVRAGSMGILLLLSKLLHTHSDVFTNMSIAVLFILVFNPYSIFSLSFQLSFGGTLGILLFQRVVYSILQNIIKGKLCEIISVTLSAQILILPISIFHFNIISIYFLVTNLLVGLVIGPIMICSLIFFVVACLNIKIATGMVIIPKVAIQVILFISKFSKIPLAKVYIATPKLWQICIYLMIILVIYFLYEIYFTKYVTNTKKRFRNLIATYRFYICYRGRSKIRKIVSIIAIVVFCFVIGLWSIPKSLKVHFVDVGQGDSTFIKTPKGQTILIDGGGATNYNVGKNTLLPYILDRGYTKIDIIIISHFDIDHVRFYPIFITRNKSEKGYNRETI